MYVGGERVLTVTVFCTKPVSSSFLATSYTIYSTSKNPNLFRGHLSILYHAYEDVVEHGIAHLRQLEGVRGCYRQ
jgi:hypothetical protein